MIEGGWLTLVRFGFRLLYNEFAWTYDAVSWIVSLGAWRCWTRAALKFLPPDPDMLVLEMAYGTGNLQVDLARAGVRAIGFDLSPAMSTIASHKLRRAGFSMPLLRADARTLPFSDRSFRAVISTFPTSSIVSPEALNEVHRVLTDDGLLIIIPHASITHRGVAARLIDGLYRATGQSSADLNVESIRRWFDPYGFELSVETVACPNSRAIVILAHKRH